MAASLLTSGRLRRLRRDVTLSRATLLVTLSIIRVTLLLLLADAESFAAQLGKFLLLLAPELLELSLAFDLLLLLPLDRAETETRFEPEITKFPDLKSTATSFLKTGPYKKKA